jgi:hypothetical protein
MQGFCVDVTTAATDGHDGSRRRRVRAATRC